MAKISIISNELMDPIASYLGKNDESTLVIRCVARARGLIRLPCLGFHHRGAPANPSTGRIHDPESGSGTIDSFFEKLDTEHRDNNERNQPPGTPSEESYRAVMMPHDQGYQAWNRAGP
ncbi:hypothetical protein N7539_003033 [Penicillium diatomitis]|uniref:Uncharacterized protein n=1 Tax=Penicillium diatomitis TaxID=2819901 RepID=A0A9W9XFU7_9EURO|nr:uncharacterized protein N7539_003033 [Penicillium diatomitis]KAJ5491466.1 hypothetical protein N7539_003033 [Penicillium diatomitis]